MANKKNKPQEAVKASAKETKSAEGFSFGTKESHLWALTGLAFLGFYFYSKKSIGYYQDDEIAHFMSMMGFWDDPTSIMGNWAKPGYKLLYALPVKLGYNFVLLLNCAISALGCWFAAKTAQHFNKNAAVFALLLAATQPVWVEMSFRNYADILSGVLLIASIYFALKEKWLLSSLILSYDILVRQEFLVLLLMYGLYLLIQRKWVPMFALGIFPLLFALWTLSVHGDFWYMLTEARETSAAYAKEYPKQGLEHYPFMSAVIFGALQIALLSVAIYQIIKICFQDQWNKKSTDPTWIRVVPYTPLRLSVSFIYNLFKKLPKDLLFVFIPFLVFFTIHCIFNMKSPEIGPATGGNLRYMTAVTPLVGVLGALSLLWMKRPSYTELGIVLGITSLIVAAFMTYDHNYVKLATDENTGEEIKSWLPLGIFITGAALYFLPLKGFALLGYIAVFTSIFLNGTLHPYQLSPENVTLQKFVKKLTKQGDFKNRPLYCNHSTLWFYWLTETNERKEQTGTLDSTSIAAAPVGSLFAWDSHYGYRPNRTPGSVKPEFFTPDKYKLIEPMVLTSTDQRFQIAVFEKIK